MLSWAFWAKGVWRERKKRRTRRPRNLIWKAVGLAWLMDDRESRKDLKRWEFERQASVSSVPRRCVSSYERPERMPFRALTTFSLKGKDLMSAHWVEFSVKISSGWEGGRVWNTSLICASLMLDGGVQSKSSHEINGGIPESRLD